jgi:hypothetical protein
MVKPRDTEIQVDNQLCTLGYSVRNVLHPNRSSDCPEIVKTATQFHLCSVLP